MWDLYIVIQEKINLKFQGEILEKKKTRADTIQQLQNITERSRIEN